MTLLELDNYFNSFLNKENFLKDPSCNGIQIQNSAPETKEITKVAFAVDACSASIINAAKEGAQVLFVHHGLFWGSCEVLKGFHYTRVAECIKNDIALCAYHIPLDANDKVGNNAGIAAKLNLKKIAPFGKWHDMVLGVKGELQKPMAIDEIFPLILRRGKNPLTVLSFGKKEIQSVGIISGGASSEVLQAAENNLDLYITGEFQHEDYHTARELHINVIACGHYETEIVGINLVREKLEKEKHIETVFIDVATNL